MGQTITLAEAILVSIVVVLGWTFIKTLLEEVEKQNK